VEVREVGQQPSRRRVTVRVREVEVDVEADAVVDLVASLLDLLERRGATR
jgi:hypothetical protein